MVRLSQDGNEHCHLGQSAPAKMIEPGGKMKLMMKDYLHTGL